MILALLPRSILLSALIVGSELMYSEACVTPTGLTADSFARYAFPPPPFGIFGAVITTTLPIATGLYETSIEMRNTLGLGSGLYGAAAAL